jgi:hypothetical protein
MLAKNDKWIIKLGNVTNNEYQDLFNQTWKGKTKLEGSDVLISKLY